MGLGGAVVGGLFVAVLHLFERGLWPTHWSNWAHLPILIGVGIAVTLLIKVLGSPGDVELLVNSIHVNGGPEDISDLKSLIPVSLLCIASGAGMGPEAPLVQTTGALARWVAGKWGLSRDEARILAITGMAAGFTVLFGAPLGSAIFALEILHRRGLEYHEALLPAVIGALVGYIGYALTTSVGLQPVWHFPSVGAIHGRDLIWAMGAGLVGAGISVLFTYMCTAQRWLLAHISPLARPVIGGVALGALAFWSPFALTYGEGQVNGVAIHRAVATFFLVAVLAKLCGTSVTLSSGWRGGFIIPMFFIGTAMGGLAHSLFPGTNQVVMMAAFMAAINTGVTKTPLGSTLVVTQMAGLPVLPTTLIGALIALLTTSQVSLIHTQAERQRPLEEP